jgi:hypothetical protein
VARVAELEDFIDQMEITLGSDKLLEDLEQYEGNQPLIEQVIAATNQRRLMLAQAEQELASMGSDGVNAAGFFEEVTGESLEGKTAEEVVEIARAALIEKYNEAQAAQVEAAEKAAETAREQASGVIGTRVGGLADLADQGAITVDPGTGWYEPNLAAFGDDIAAWQNYFGVAYRYQPFLMLEGVPHMLGNARSTEVDRSDRWDPGVSTNPTRTYYQMDQAEVLERLQQSMRVNYPDTFGALNPALQASIAKAIQDSATRKLDWDSASEEDLRMWAEIERRSDRGGFGLAPGTGP